MIVHALQRRLLGLSFFGTALLCITTEGHSTGFESLLRNSPFGRPAVATADGPSGQPLEFRGVMVDGGKEYFSVRETKTRSAAWVAINEPGNPYTIRGYDTARGILTVEYQGSILDLPLKDAVILVSSPGNARPPLPEPTATEAGIAGGFRIGHVAEEVARRRAAAQPPPPATRSQ